MTRTQIVSTKSTKTPVKLFVVPSCQGLNGNPGLKSQTGRVMGRSSCKSGSESFTVQFGDLQGAVLWMSLPGYPLRSFTERSFFPTLGEAEV